MELEDLLMAYGGTVVDHLYTDCPTFIRSRNKWGDNRNTPWIGAALQGKVDPLGTDICGWCQQVWKARHQTSDEQTRRKPCPVKCPCICHDTGGSGHDHYGQPCPGKSEGKR